MNLYITRVLRFAGRTTSLLAVGLLLTLPTASPNAGSPSAYAIYLCSINAVLAGYICYVHRHKRHRYAEIIAQVHSVNHLIRDWLSSIQIGARRWRQPNDAAFGIQFTRDFNHATIKALDQISDAFSYLCGKRCAVCVKELQPGDRLRVVFRDSISGQTRGLMDSSRVPHEARRDTPCNVLLNTHCTDRFYACNDVITEWDRRHYDSPTFDFASKPPRVFRLFGRRFPQHWPLHYRSCLVVPIRYVTCIKPPAPSSDEEWNYWGFLCIDCNSRGVFDVDRCWELAAAVADILYVHFSHSFVNLRQDVHN